MKRLYIYAVAAIALISCQDEQMFDQNPSASNQNISYDSSVKKSRATEVGDDELEAYGRFNVATFIDDSTKEPYYNDNVVYNSGVWSSGINRYWPVGRALNMFAYSPFESFITLDNITSYEDYSLHYVCPSDVDDQIDLLAKTLKGQTYDSNNGALDCKFNHILSSIKFNVEIMGERNVTLNHIDIKYKGIVKEGTYNFANEEWDLTDTPVYFEGVDETRTTIAINERLEGNSGSLKFENINNQLMILPQTISHAENDPHYMSIQVTYNLNSASDGTSQEVKTGVMPLPKPVDSDEYLKGKVYTYNLIISGEIIKFVAVSIEDQVEPEQAYGNIDLKLITEYKTAADIGYTGTDETSAQLYYTTSERVKDLLNDGVRDFVIAGSVGASSESTGNALGNGKLGYYGNISSPFYIGPKMTGLPSDDCFSIDLRGTYDYPRYSDVKSEDINALYSVNEDLNDDDKIFISGLFSHNQWLDEVIFPHGIAAIGYHSFDYCTALQTMYLADVKHIHPGAFQNCENLETVTGGELRRVYKNGFDNCKKLHTIDLSNLVEVDEYGFVDCAELTNVDLHNLDSIGPHAFDGCTNLTLVAGTAIPGFHSVEDYAFSGCTRLGENGARLDLTDAVIVGDHSFADCLHINLSSGDLNSLTKVGDFGFSDCELLGTGLTFRIPLLESVGISAFSGCKNVNIVDGLQNLEIIPQWAFENCTSLTGVVKGASSTLVEMPLVREIEPQGLFNTAIEKLHFGDKLTTIGLNAFTDCSKITSITGLDKVTSVGQHAFSGCVLLEELYLPSLESDNCGGDFFFGCKSLKVVDLPLLTENDLSWIDDEGKYHESTIIKMINGDFKDIERINLPALTAPINGWHFQQKANLKYVNFSSAPAIEDGAFANCPLLETLIAPKITSLGNYALQSCVSLKAVDFPLLTSLGDFALNKCSGLIEINLPNIDGLFGGWAYWGESDDIALKYVNLPSVEAVAQGTFYNCAELVAADLRSAKSVGGNLFDGCKNLVRLNLSGVTDAAKVDIENGFMAGFDQSKCEIWVSDVKLLPGDGGKVWMGETWKAVHRVSDNVPFSLK